MTKNTNPIFRFVHASDIEFLNCTVQNSFNAHHLEMGGIKGLSILGCTFSDYSQDKASLKKEAVQLDICNNVLLCRDVRCMMMHGVRMY